MENCKGFLCQRFSFSLRFSAQHSTASHIETTLARTEQNRTKEEMRGREQNMTYWNLSHPFSFAPLWEIRDNRLLFLANSLWCKFIKIAESAFICLLGLRGSSLSCSLCFSILLLPLCHFSSQPPRLFKRQGVICSTTVPAQGDVETAGTWGWGNIELLCSSVKVDLCLCVREWQCSVRAYTCSLLCCDLVPTVRTYYVFFDLLKTSPLQLCMLQYHKVKEWICLIWAT